MKQIMVMDIYKDKRGNYMFRSNEFDIEHNKFCGREEIVVDDILNIFKGDN